MGEVQEVVAQNNYPREVRIIPLESDQGNKPLLQIDGRKLATALQEGGYPASTVKPLRMVTEPDSFEIAAYKSLMGEVELNDQAIIEGLHGIRNSMYKSLEATPKKKNRFIRLLQKIGDYANPISLPYMLLPNQGQTSHFHGAKERRLEYFKMAREGTLVLTEDGKPDQEASIARAKQHIDRILEYIAPNIVGWVLAHEYEHVNHGVRKRATALGMMAAPFAAICIASGLTNTDIMQLIGPGVFGTYVGAILGRRADESASYKAGDAHYGEFAQAVSIDHGVFLEKVLGKNAEATQKS